MTDPAQPPAEATVEPPEYLTLRQLADRAGVSAYTLRKLIKRGELPAVVQDQNSGVIVSMDAPRPQPYQYLVAAAYVDRARELATAQAGPSASAQAAASTGEVLEPPAVTSAPETAQPPITGRLNPSEQGLAERLSAEAARSAELQEQLTAEKIENAALKAERDTLAEEVDYMRGLVVGLLPPARPPEPAPVPVAAQAPKRRWWPWRRRSGGVGERGEI